MRMLLYKPAADKKLPDANENKKIRVRKADEQMEMHSSYALCALFFLSGVYEMSVI